MAVLRHSLYDLRTSPGVDGTINVVAPFPGGYAMDGKTGELWRKFCEQAAIEQDAERLLELAQEINRLLDEKEVRLQKLRQRPAENAEL